MKRLPLPLINLFLLAAARLAFAELSPLIIITTTAGHHIAALATDMPWDDYNGFCTEDACSGDPHDDFLAAVYESAHNITRAAQELGYPLSAKAQVDQQGATVPTNLNWTDSIPFVRSYYFFVGSASNDSHTSWAREALLDKTNPLIHAFKKDEKTTKEVAIILFILVGVIALVVCCFALASRKKLASINCPKINCFKYKFWERTTWSYEPFGSDQSSSRKPHGGEVELGKSIYQQQH